MRWRFGVAAVALVLLAAGTARAADVAAPTAQIQTSLGTITIALDRAHAPATVANFIAYAREGHFNGTMIYRVEPGFVIQMGSFEASGMATLPRTLERPLALSSAI